MQELLEILEAALPNVDWTSDEALVDDGVLDSIDIITVISEITSEYGVTVSTDMMKAENFNSVEAIYEMIQTLLDE